jgi:DNA-binding transcriptional ArsR family regulator
MRNVIELMNARFAAVTHRRYKNERKLRKDSILGGLPPEQRAKVDKWLFDKGMTYDEVAEACGKMFGVTVSRSSVGRYFQAKSEVQMQEFKVQSPKSKVGEDGVTGVSGSVGETETPGTVDEQYQSLLAKVREMAWREGNLPAELRDVMFFCQLMRILIAARRERNQAVLARVDRAKFEVWAAGKVLKYLRGGREKVSGFDLKVSGWNRRAVPGSQNGIEQPRREATKMKRPRREWRL